VAIFYILFWGVLHPAIYGVASVDDQQV